ncbi:MAG: InlB B-repeat-containing protein [Clostridia bacterium]|nr:InlB B-repeat-containing protein [Clostridia bacterium]
MKYSIKSVVSIFVSVMIVISSVAVIGFVNVFADSDETDLLIEYIEFGDDYAKSGNSYYGPDNDAYTRATLADGRIQFSKETNKGNSYGYRSFLATNNKNNKYIIPDKTYRVVFDLFIPSGGELKNYNVQFGLGADIWHLEDNKPFASTTADKLDLEDQTTDGSYAAYTLAYVFSGGAANTNLSISIYPDAQPSGNYYVDDVYIYEGTRYYKVETAEGEDLGETLGFIGSDVLSALGDANLDIIGFDMSVSPEKFPENTSEKIVVTYTPKENLVQYVNFDSKYAKTGSPDDYYTDSTGYTLLGNKRFMFTDAANSSVSFKDRAVLLANSSAENILGANKKYRIVFDLNTGADIKNYTVELKYGSTVKSIVASGPVFSGDELESFVVETKTGAGQGGTDIYTVSFDFVSAGDTNPLISVYGTNYCYLNNVVLRRFFDYDVEESDGTAVGKITGFAGDPIDLAENETLLSREDYTYELSVDLFPQKSDERIMVSYTSITVLEAIDFSGTYAQKHRSGNYPVWQYIGNPASSGDARVEYSDGQVRFFGTANVGNSYGNRSVLLTNDRTTTLIEQGARYRLVFDMYLQNEQLSTKTFDLRFGSDVWNPAGSYVDPIKANKLNTVSQKVDGTWTVYTLSYDFIAPLSKNLILSIYGDGNSGAVLVKNVYINKPIGYTCVDENGTVYTDSNGNPMKLYAFPGEALDEAFISATEFNRPDMFETVSPETAPNKSADRITVTYTKDPSYILLNDFSSGVYTGSDKTRYVVSNATVAVEGERMKITPTDGSEKFRAKSFVVSTDYKSDIFKAGQKYFIDFELEIPQNSDLSDFSVEFRSGRFAGNGLGSTGTDYIESAPAVFGGSDLKANVASFNENTNTYKISLDYTLAPEENWGSYSERNILMGVFFSGYSNAYIDNIEIVKKTAVKLANTDLGNIIGRIGHKLVLPEDVSMQGYVFGGWFADPELTSEFTADVFPVEDITVYAKMTSAVLDTEMHFDAMPPAVAGMTGFAYQVIPGAIAANTSSGSLAYIKLYKDSKAIRMANSDYYPISLRYKTDKYTGTFILGIATALQNDFSKAKSVIHTEKLSASNSWQTIDFCVSQEFAYDNGVKGDYIYLFVEYSNVNGGAIMIDDVVLKQETTVRFDTCGGNNISDIKGKPGAAATLPIPVNGVKSFSGWYYDKEYSSAVPANFTYPVSNCEITLYASWDNQKATFAADDIESGELDFSKNQKGATVFSVSHNAVYKGQSSVRYHFDPDTNKSLTMQESTFKLTGDQGNSGAGIAVKNDKYYGLSFYIYAKKMDARVNFNVYTADGNNVFSSGATVTNALGKTPYISQNMTEQGVWKRVDYVFKPNIKTAGANELFLAIATSKSSIETDIYIDYVTVTELTDDMGGVAFESSVYNAALVDHEFLFAYGKVGEEFKYPRVTRENYVLEGWYTNYRFTAAFNPVFKNNTEKGTYVYVAYPQWDITGICTVSFENANHFAQDGNGTSTTNKFTNTRGGVIVTGEVASDGQAAYKYDSYNKYASGGEKVLALKDIDGSPFRLVDNKTYIISVDVYVDKFVSDYSFWFSTGSQDNYYAWQGTQSGKIIVNGDVERGKWITTSFTYSAVFGDYGGFNLFLANNASASKTSQTVVYFDNVKIEPIDEDVVTVIENTGLLGGSSKRLVGKPGDEYSLSKTLNIPNYVFSGWYSSPSLERSIDFDDFFSNTKTVYAKLIPAKIKQDFEASPLNPSLIWGTDSDYEIYSPGTDGYNAANVHDGEKSLHRIGNDHMLKNAVIVSKNAQLSPGDVYKISMWVKMDSYDQTNGAIKISSSSSPRYAWNLTGDLRPLVAIADLTDGNWHKITGTFMSSAYYLVVQTPGYCSIYMDDITIEYAGGSLEESNVEFKEYIAVKKDASGKIPTVTEEKEQLLIDSKIDEYLKNVVIRYDTVVDEVDNYYTETNTYTKHGGKIKTKRKSTTVSRTKIPLKFMDIVKGNTYIWYTVLFYAGIAFVVVAAVGTVLIVKLVKNKRKAAASDEE